MKIEPNAFRYTNLARSELVKACNDQFRRNISGMTRDEKFALYNQLDKQIVETAIDLAKMHRDLDGKPRELEDFFGQAAIAIVNQFNC